MPTFEFEYRVHPSVGIARMGNSEKAYFLGPEMPWSPINPFTPVQRDILGAGASRKAAAGKIRDLDGKLCKQGVRFRVYCYQYEVDTTGPRPLRNLLKVWECKADKYEIEWTVKVVNGKATRSSTTGGAEVINKLAITWPRELNAPNSVALKSAVAADRNKRKVFTGKPTGRLPLGSCFMDVDGRLTVLGSAGNVQRMSGSSQPPVDNVLPINLYWPGWEDDAADGPITAMVKPKASNGRPDAAGAQKAAVGAWVVINMPSYGADVFAPVTLYDLALNHAYDQAMLAVAKSIPTYLPDKRKLITYHTCVKPMQYAQYSVPFVAEANSVLAGARYVTAHKQWIGGLASVDRAKANDLVKKSVMRSARITRESVPENIWLQYTASDMNTGNEGLPRYKGKPASTNVKSLFWDVANNGRIAPIASLTESMPHLLIVTLTELQHFAIKELKAGTIAIGDTVAESTAAEKFEPYQLDRANLESMSGGSFFPGLEVGRTAGFPAVWSGREGCCDQHYDARITNKIDDEGVVIGSAEAGMMTWNLANPWQADFTNCVRDYWPYTSLSVVQSEAGAATGWKLWLSATDPNVVPAAGSPVIFSHLHAAGMAGNRTKGGFIDAWWRVGFARFDPVSKEIFETERDSTLGNVLVPV